MARRRRSAYSGGEVEGHLAQEVFDVSDGLKRYRLAEDRRTDKLFATCELFPPLLFLGGVMPEAKVGAAHCPRPTRLAAGLCANAPKLLKFASRIGLICRPAHPTDAFRSVTDTRAFPKVSRDGFLPIDTLGIEIRDMEPATLLSVCYVFHAPRG